MFLCGGKFRITTKNNLKREISRSATLQMGCRKNKIHGERDDSCPWRGHRGAEEERAEEVERQREEAREDDMLFLCA